MEWRRHITGILHRSFRHFKEQGHLGLEPASWHYLHSLVPDAWKETTLLSTIMATVHVLADAKEFLLTLHDRAMATIRNPGPAVEATAGPAMSNSHQV